MKDNIIVSRESIENVLDAMKSYATQYPHMQKGYLLDAMEVLEAVLENSHSSQDFWRPIETAPTGRIVLVHYKNRLGNGRTMRARYYLPETLDSDSTESGWADEGWYEESEAYEYLMPLEGEPTHWCPLPDAPKS